MKNMFLTAAAALAAVALGLTGCQSTSGFKSSFASHPKPKIQSPAEMDDINLKAPPERYTRDDYLRQLEEDSKKGESFAQKGSYSARGQSEDFDSGEDARSVRQSRTNSMVPAAYASGGGGISNDLASTAAPGVEDSPVSENLGGRSVPFAPGSIGGY